jgi:uncharacterized pyridoxal phosphate-containing UPF0001 family protein
VDTLRLPRINGAANWIACVASASPGQHVQRAAEVRRARRGRHHLAEQIETLPNLQLIGLMTMAPLTRDQDVIRTCFARAHELFCEMRGEKIVGPQFTELSMGMSSDYEIAIEEGATILRIGSAIFAGS